MSLWMSMCFSSSLVKAHEIRPAYLELTEGKDKKWNVLWKQPVMGEIAVKLVPHLSSEWLEVNPSKVSLTHSFLIKKWNSIDPGGLSLKGQTITIEGLESTITDVLVVIRFSDGKSIQEILNPKSPSFKISNENQASIQILGYIKLGVEHILEGIDHLLFVLGLLLLVRKKSLLLKTITAFTIAHSLTLTSAVLGWIYIPQEVVEAIIALSIVFMGVELINSYKGIEGLTIRYPWLIAFSFGLLHGFGFAGALMDIGLPEDSIASCLLLFNVGVEIGQLMFVSAALILMWLFKSFIESLPIWTKWIPPYAIGSFASYWLIERLLVIFY